MGIVAGDEMVAARQCVGKGETVEEEEQRGDGETGNGERHEGSSVLSRLMITNAEIKRQKGDM